MMLKSVKISGLRSIDETELSDCGALNILIGKNNAGKSNILSAIPAFFNVVSAEDILVLKPTYKEDVDFFNKNTKRPIEITCCFLISEDLNTQIISSMNSEYPQVKNVILGLAKCRHMNISVKYYYSSSPFATITNIALSELAGEFQHDAIGTSVYQVSDQAAYHLFERSLKVNTQTQSLVDLQRIRENISPDNYNAIKRDATGRGSLPTRFYIQRSLERNNEEIVDAAEQDFTNSGNFSEFRSALDARISEMSARISSMKMAPIGGDILTVGGQGHEVPRYVTNICGRLADINVLYRGERRQPIGAQEAEQLLSVRVQKGGDKLFREFQQIVNTLIGVEVDAFEAAVPGKAAPRSRETRRAQLDVDNFLIQVNGSGIKEALRILLDSELEKPSIMLIEEPEVHLHPALETSMRRYLKQISNRTQIFLTTHSTHFVDSGEYSSIYFVSKKGDKTIATLMTSEEAADVLPEDLGLSLSSVFMFEKLLFVEGPSDEGVIREWAALLRKNLTQAGIGVICIGGSRNVKHFAAKKTTEFLTRRGVELWFVIDRDEGEKEELTKLKETLGSHCSITTLPVREIENYLVKPEPLARYISARIADEKVEVTADSISIAVEECANKLHDFTLAKAVFNRVNVPAYVRAELDDTKSLEQMIEDIKTSLCSGAESLRDRAKKVDDALVEIKPSFDIAWAVSKLKIVPGAELLDAIFKRFGITYKKMRDARGIAAAMYPSEVPVEVANLLNDIVV